MKVLILGGTGVLSRPVFEQCLLNGYDTYVLNRGHNKRPNLCHDHLYIADLRKAEDVKGVIGDERFDVIVDFLSYTPEQLKNTLSIFEGHMEQYVFISSATAYSIVHNSEPITEEHELVETGWKYAVDKHRCEKIVVEKAKKYNFQYTIIRPYVTYGETRIPFALCKRYQQWSVVNRIIKGKPVLMWDDGTSLCPLTYASDFAFGVGGLLGNEKAYGQAFHITSDEKHTWNDVLRILGNLLGKDEPAVFYLPSKTLEKEFPEYGNELTGDKARSYFFDNSKIKNAVPGYKCEISLEEGLSRVIKYYYDNPEMQKVDIKWDGAVDRVIAKYCKDDKIIKSVVYIPTSNYNAAEHKQYQNSRNAFMHFIRRSVYLLKKHVKKNWVN